MVCPAERDCITHRRCLKTPNIVSGHLKPFDMVGILLGAFADLLCSSLDAFSQDISHTFPHTDLSNEFNHRLAVAEPQVDAIRILLGQDSIFVAVHRKSDDVTSRQVVKSVNVA